QEVVAELPLRGREGDDRRRRPADEEAKARIAEAARAPRLPEREHRERRPGQRDRGQVLRVEEKVVRERLRRVGAARGEAAGQVAEVASDEVRVDELTAPACERRRIPAEAEDGEGGGCPEQVGTERRRPRYECRTGERRGQPDRRLREPRGGARERREPVVEDWLVGEQLAVEARPEPVAGGDVLDDARLARLVVADDVRGAEPVECGDQVAGGEQEPASA